MEELQIMLDTIKLNNPQYNYGTITVSAAPINGRKVAYASGSRKGKTVSGKIVIDREFIEYAKDQHPAELMATLKHELSHLIAETFNKNKKHIWHGKAWKEVYTAMGGDGERYYKGSFTKKANEGIEFKSKAELYATLPTHPATEWERGTFRQWLERGYHVKKGEHGQLHVWKFVTEDAYETQDGQEGHLGTSRAVYFTADQVEANVPKTVEA